MQKPAALGCTGELQNSQQLFSSPCAGSGTDLLETCCVALAAAAADVRLQQGQLAAAGVQGPSAPQPCWLPLSPANQASI